MKPFNFFVLPYRDMYFIDKYGPAVRDTQIITALAALDNVERVTVVNRPVSLYERATSKPLTKNLNRGKIHYIDKTSLDLFGPLSGRKWFSRCYDHLNQSNFYIDGCNNVILDFLPIGGIDYGSVRHDFVWYDFIDNFSKHNRFDQREKDLVRQKYERVSSFSDVITGVSQGSIKGYNNAIVLPNAPGISPASRGAVTLDPSAADFGFIGFITNKFDIDLVQCLTARGRSVIIHGEFYDKAVENSLRTLPGVTTTGMFEHRDIPNLMSTFKVGLIPYRTDRLHDESPLKLYQYLLHGRSVLTSTEFELSGSAVVSYHGRTLSEAAEQAVALLARSVTREGQSDAVSMIVDGQFWVPKLKMLLESAFKAGSAAAF